jgi:hypothetical protein
VNQPLATLIAAIVTAMGSTLVGTAAVIFAWRQSLRTLIQQRQMATDERLSERRIALYLSVLEVLLVETDSSSMADALRRLQPQIVAFASDEVQEVFEDLLASSVDAVHSSGDTRMIGQGLEIRRTSLMSIVRSELQPPRTT